MNSPVKMAILREGYPVSEQPYRSATAELRGTLLHHFGRRALRS
jgi:hypothetical protein